MQPILFTYSQLKAKSVKGFRCSQFSCENGRLRGLKNEASPLLRINSTSRIRFIFPAEAFFYIELLADL